MSKGINKVIIVGNLGNDPKISYTPNQVAIANLSVATSESWKDKNTGETTEKTEWHNIVFFNRQAEICREYLRKGSKIYVEGKLVTEKWKDKHTNENRYATKIHAYELQMLDGTSKNDHGYKPPLKDDQLNTSEFDDSGDIPF